MINFFLQLVRAAARSALRLLEYVVLLRACFEECFDPGWIVVAQGLALGTEKSKNAVRALDQLRNMKAN